MKKEVAFTKREFEVMKVVAYGAAVKEVPDLIYPGPHGKVTESCVAHAIERIKAKTGLQKVTEIAAYYFCHYRGADASDCPTQIKSILIAGTMLVVLMPTILSYSGDFNFCRTGRATNRIVRTARARRFEFEPEMF